VVNMASTPSKLGQVGSETITINNNPPSRKTTTLEGLIQMNYVNLEDRPIEGLLVEGVHRHMRTIYSSANGDHFLLAALYVNWLALKY
jgi:hypothetical protein